MAFTENATRFMVESDVWVMEAESGELRNLTDDGIAGSIFKAQSGKEEAWLDIAPDWSPDGKQLIFARSICKENQQPGTELHRVPETGGGAEKLLVVTRDDRLTVWYGLRWSRKSIL
jgi:Tol biopolymer transport system component